MNENELMTTEVDEEVTGEIMEAEDTGSGVAGVIGSAAIAGLGAYGLFTIGRKIGNFAMSKWDEIKQRKKKTEISSDEVEEIVDVEVEEAEN